MMLICLVRRILTSNGKREITQRFPARIFRLTGSAKKQYIRQAKPVQDGLMCRAIPAGTDLFETIVNSLNFYLSAAKPFAVKRFVISATSVCNALPGRIMTLNSMI